MEPADNTRTSVERRLRAAVLTGELVDLRAGHPTEDDPAGGAEWGEARAVTATLLAELLTSGGGSSRPRALRLAGARVLGLLDLEAATLACPLLLAGCWFEEPVNLAEAQAPAVRLPGCHLPGVYARQLNTGGNLELDKGFTVRGQMVLAGCRVGGDLSLAGAHLANSDERALDAQAVTVEGNMFCRWGFSADGEVDLMGAKIRGELSFTSSVVKNPGAMALHLQGIEVGQDLKCRREVTIEGEVSLVGAHVHGALDMFHATLSNPGGAALTAAGLTVDAGMDCGSGFSAEGWVNLHHAHIGGDLSFIDAHLANAGGVVLYAQGMTVDGNMLCRAGFTADGEVDLMGSRIGGELSFTNSRLRNPEGMALQAQGIEVGQDLKCRRDVTIQGEVSLLGAHIHGTLDMFHARLSNPGGRALGAGRLTVDQDMGCNEGFTAEGLVDLSAAHVSGELSFAGAHLANRGGHALRLRQLKASMLTLTPAEPPDGLVDLAYAHVGTLADEEASWPPRLRLRGFTYDTLDEPSAVRAAARLRWLERDEEGFSPQPYEQLAAVYRRAGREQDARAVALAKQRARGRALATDVGHRRVVAGARRAWSLLLDALVGHGYRTWLAGVWLLGLVLVGWWVFDLAHPAHLVPTGPPAGRPQFHGGLYALDLLLPIGDLNYQGSWIARGWARGFWLAWILAGWVLTTAVLAAFAGLLKRD